MSATHSRRPILLAFGAVTVLILSVVGVQSLSSDEDAGPATPAASREVALPTANTGWKEDAKLTALFDRFTFDRPSIEVWDGEDAHRTDSQPYTDISGCSSDCTIITFVNLADTESARYYGDNPPSVWANESCTLGPAGKLASSKEFDLDGQTARYYLLPCGAEGEYSAHAWYVPGKDLFVTTLAGSGGPMSPEILRSVMDTVKWSR
jgi:hypothetical protein